MYHQGMPTNCDYMNTTSVFGCAFCVLLFVLTSDFCLLPRVSFRAGAGLPFLLFRVVLDAVLVELEELAGLGAADDFDAGQPMLHDVYFKSETINHHL